MDSGNNSEMLSLKPHKEVLSKGIVTLYTCSYIKCVNETKIERDKVKKITSLRAITIVSVNDISTS